MSLQETPGSLTRCARDMHSPDAARREEAARQIWLRFSGRLRAVVRQRLAPEVLRRAGEDDVLQSLFASFFAAPAGSGGDEAVAAARKATTIQREVLGELHEEVVITLQFLARLHEMCEDWAGAREALTQVLAIRQRQPEPNEWCVADAQRALGDLDRRAAMRPDQRQRLGRADALNRAVMVQLQQGKYETAKAAARECWACSVPSRRRVPAPWWRACGKWMTRPLECS
jgi:hypothetical protein